MKEGFLCPLCYLAFENSDKLTEHFSKTHDEPIETKSLNSNFESERTSMKTSESRSSLFNPKIESVINLIFY